jgi:hypothetical protein
MDGSAAAAPQTHKAEVESASDSGMHKSITPAHGYGASMLGNLTSKALRAPQ